MPESCVAVRLRKSLKKGLIDLEKCMPGGSFKSTLARLSGGGLTESPFPEQEVEKIWDNLRTILMQEGFEDGLPKEGARVQLPEVRLVQEPLRASMIQTATFASGGLAESGWGLWRGPCPALRAFTSARPSCR